MERLSVVAAAPVSCAVVAGAVRRVRNRVVDLGVDVVVNLLGDVLVNLLVDAVLNVEVRPRAEVLTGLGGENLAKIIRQPLDQCSRFAAAGPHHEGVEDLVHRVFVAVG
jgi:hypothetical protein